MTRRDWTLLRTALAGSFLEGGPAGSRSEPTSPDLKTGI